MLVEDVHARYAQWVHARPRAAANGGRRRLEPGGPRRLDHAIVVRAPRIAELPDRDTEAVLQRTLAAADLVGQPRVIELRQARMRACVRVCAPSSMPASSHWRNCAALASGLVTPSVSADQALLPPSRSDTA